MLVSTITDALQDHISGCQSYLSVTERFRLTQLCTSYNRQLIVSSPGGTTRRFDWFDFVFTSCNFFFDLRLPLAELDPNRVIRHNVSVNTLHHEEFEAELLLPWNEYSLRSSENQDPGLPTDW
jgi:hypothetical protein